MVVEFLSEHQGAVVGDDNFKIEKIIEKLNQQFLYLFFSKNGLWCARDNGNGSKRDGAYIDTNMIPDLHNEVFEKISNGEDTQSEFFHDENFA